MAICLRYSTRSPVRSSTPTLRGQIASTPATMLPPSTPTARGTPTRRGRPNCSCPVQQDRPDINGTTARPLRPRRHTTHKTLEDRNQPYLTTPLQGMLHPPRPRRRATLPSPRAIHLPLTIPRPTQVSLHPSASRPFKATPRLPTTTPIPQSPNLQPPRTASQSTLPTVLPTITGAHPRKYFSHQVVIRSTGAAYPAPANIQPIRRRQ